MRMRCKKSSARPAELFLHLEYLGQQQKDPQVEGIKGIEKPFVKGTAFSLFSIIKKDKGNDLPGHPVRVDTEHIKALENGHGWSPVQQIELEQAVQDYENGLFYFAVPKEIGNQHQG